MGQFILLIFSLCMWTDLASQEFDQIYVEFDGDCNYSYFVEGEKRVTFLLHPQINQSRFVHSKGSHKMKHTCCMEIKKQLISKAKLNDFAIVRHMENQKEFEEETGIKGLLPVILSLNLNALFNK